MNRGITLPELIVIIVVLVCLSYALGPIGFISCCVLLILSSISGAFSRPRPYVIETYQ